jgi:predicted nucleic acid-binding protein
MLEICPVDANLIRGAYKYLNRFIDQPLTLTDAVGLELMSSQRIKHCWSTDRHLNLTGVLLVGW